MLTDRLLLAGISPCTEEQRTNSGKVPTSQERRRHIRKLHIFQTHNATKPSHPPPLLLPLIFCYPAATRRPTGSPFFRASATWLYNIPADRAEGCHQLLATPFLYKNLRPCISGYWPLIPLKVRCASPRNHCCILSHISLQIHHRRCTNSPRLRVLPDANSQTPTAATKHLRSSICQEKKHGRGELRHLSLQIHKPA